MTTRIYCKSLLLLALLVALLLGCVDKSGGDGISTCHQLWVNCPGTANDYVVANNASDLRQEVSGGTRFFAYYNCSSGSRTPTLSIPAECRIGFKY